MKFSIDYVDVHSYKQFEKTLLLEAPRWFGRVSVNKIHLDISHCSHTDILNIVKPEVERQLGRLLTHDEMIKNLHYLSGMVRKKIFYID